ncbi:MAG: cation transporting ATPase C-terminal domain-containing protein [Bacteroidaceae bacterium]|nr:cation transporting ATPase C-terminal domain-containing protein [Bacteroidaceae bacterium]
MWGRSLYQNIQRFLLFQLTVNVSACLIVLVGAFLGTESPGRAVMWGRSLYQNIQRFLLFQLTVNVSACLIVLVGAFLGTESPLTVTQMLWINLIMDTFGAMALASLPPSTRVMNQPPRDRNAFILNRSMYANILGVGTAFFLMLLALVLIFQHAEVNSMRDLLHFTWGPANAVTPYEQTLIFSIFVWTHFWYMFNARAYATGRSIFRTRMSRGFWIITLVIFVGQIAIVELLAPFFNVTSMFNHPSGVEDFVLIVVLSSVVLWVREIALLVAPRK